MVTGFKGGDNTRSRTVSLINSRQSSVHSRFEPTKQEELVPVLVAMLRGYIFELQPDYTLKPH
eukprot:scaffold30774_cov54-Phaeocystis_antarctica.AAC.2